MTIWLHGQRVLLIDGPRLVYDALKHDPRAADLRNAITTFNVELAGMR